MATPDMPRTREKQYQFLLDAETCGRSRFGLMSGQVWRDDPRRLAFVLAPGDDIRVVGNMAASLDPHGVVILGCPFLQSPVHASPPSREGRVNRKDAHGLRGLLVRFFHSVFLFSMNDELVHTGLSPIVHSLIGIGCDGRQSVVEQAG